MKRLLFIAHRVPYPPDKGERVRAFHEIQALRRHFRVTVAALSHTRGDLQAVAGLREYCEKILVAPAGGRLGLLRGGLSMLAGRSATEGFFNSRRLDRMIADEARREPFDLVFAYSSSMLPYALRVQASARVADIVDVDSAKWSDYAGSAAWPGSWLYRLESAAVGRLERLAVERCEAVLLVSRSEAEVLGPGGEGENILAVANGVDVDFFRPDAAAPADLGDVNIVFTGTMDYKPNAEGVCWFVKQVWADLKRQSPGLRFTIVGRDPVRAVRRLAEIDGVVVTGSVPDVRGYLAAADVVVCPLRIARGIQNKVLEAMAMGRAVVASGGAIEGLDVEPGRDILRADSPDEWAGQILKLLRDPAKRAELGLAGRKRILKQYTWAQQLQPLVSMCRNLVEGGGDMELVKCPG